MAQLHEVFLIGTNVSLFFVLKKATKADLQQFFLSINKLVGAPDSQFCPNQALITSFVATWFELELIYQRS